MSRSSANNTDVFILAAGFGTRLRPLTEECPKPLVGVAGKPLIEWNMKMLAQSGFKRFIVNSHYLANKLEEYFNSDSFGSWNITLVHEPEILGTGGAIKNIENLIESDHFLTFNSDIVIDPGFNAAEILTSHLESPNDPVATMMLRDSDEAENFGLLGIDKSGGVVELLGKSYSEEVVTKRLMYTGVQILSRKVFEFMPSDEKVFGLTETVYPAIMKAGERIGSWQYQGYWNDAGTLDRLKEGEQFLLGAGESD